MTPRLTFYKEDVELAAKLLSALLRSTSLSGARLVYKDGSVLTAAGDGGTETAIPLKYDVTLVVVGSPGRSLRPHVTKLREFLDDIVARKEEGEKISREFGRHWQGPSSPA